jgi:DNA-binding GntR family transcriptional regulator
MSLKKTINVYERLRDEIVRGTIHPEQAITEEWLKEHLDVSRTPIREALIRLQEDGLVTLIKNKGAFLTPFGITDIIDIFNLRVLLEGFAARTCVDFIEQEKVKHIQDRLEELAVVPERYDEKVKAGTDLHALIIESAKNARLTKIITTLQAQVMWVRFQAERIGRVDKSLHEHLKTTKAILAHDRNQAEKSMRKHLENVLKDLIDPKNLKQLSIFPGRR